MIGNKCDLESKRVIPYTRGEQVSVILKYLVTMVMMSTQMAESQSIQYMETSAKTKQNIDEVSLYCVYM